MKPHVTARRWLGATVAVTVLLAGCTAEDSLDGLPTELEQVLRDNDVSIEDAPDTDLPEVDPCELLTTEEVAIYVGPSVEPGIVTDFWNAPPNWQCNWWDETIDGFNIVVMYYDNWDFSYYDDPDSGSVVEPFDRLGVEAMVRRPNDVGVQRDGAHPDQVYEIWARKSGYTFMFTGRMSSRNPLLADTADFDNFVEIVTIALSRVD